MIKNQILHSDEIMGESQRKLKDAIALKDELSGKQKRFFDIREELSQQMSNLDKEVYRLNAQKEMLDSESEQIAIIDGEILKIQMF